TPATIVQIQGAGFDPRVQNIGVTFNGTTATVIGATRTTIQAAVPYNATTGAVSVNILGQTAAGPNFTILSSPTSTNVPSTSFSFINASRASGGTLLSVTDADDAAGLVPLPFAFTLFDKTYAAGTTISISTNGWLSLEAVTAPYHSSVPLPGAAA